MHKLHLIKVLFLIFSFSVIVNVTLAQESYLQLAIEYYNKGEYVKATEYFEELVKNDSNVPKIYDKYLESLIKLNDQKEARQLLKQLKKRFPNDLIYEIDEIFLERNFGDQSVFEKNFKDYIDQYTKKNYNLTEIFNILMSKREYLLAEELFLTARKNQRNDLLYVQELIRVYRTNGNETGVINESINLLKSNPQNINYVQGILQNSITLENYEKLEVELIKLMQKDASGIYNEMLVWLYIQTKQFELAFIQSKALDRRYELMGSELLNLGEICFKNKDYNTALMVYSYIIDKYPKSSNYAFARQKLIETHEEIVKSTFPVEISQIQSLIKEYSEFIEELGKRKNTAESMRKMALLYAFYLGDHDTAISILSEAIKIPRTEYSFVGICKLSLGDIHLLKNEPWESTLLYAQVEKSYNDQIIGYEAKLKLAELYFYKGEFELAQENLDILKLATSREIANNAMDLSLLIQDNLALDTSTDALSDYAKIDLLKFQKKYGEAIQEYETMLNKYPNHSLSDEIYWNLANLYLQIGKPEESVEDLDNILNSHSDDIFGDDALFMKADIYENYLNKKEESMELYKTLLFDFPGSIYNAEARKRFRKLRGDFQ